MATTAEAVMTTADIAKRLRKYCQNQDFESAQRELFSRDAVSIEPEAGHGFEKETRGLDAILIKGEKWMQMVKETHGIEVSDAIVAPQSFAVVMRMDVTMHQGGRMDMKELCVYKVKDGKIISEEFFM